MSSKIGRNDLRPCGSGKKYKKCCMLDISPSLPTTWNDEAGLHVLAKGEKFAAPGLAKSSRFLPTQKCAPILPGR